MNKKHFVFFVIPVLALGGIAFILFPAFHNILRIATDGDYKIPSESSIFTFREILSNNEEGGGNGGWWTYGEDQQKYYYSNSNNDIPPLSIMKSDAKKLPDFEIMDVYTWGIPSEELDRYVYGDAPLTD